MNRALIDLLSYPRWLVLSQVDRHSCPHDGFFDGQSAVCRLCESREECSWLNEHDEFIALSRRPVDELVAALDFSIDYVRGICTDHNIRACTCDSCVWLRSALRFRDNYPAGQLPP